MSTALVIGAGPAGLMAAEVLAQAGVRVTVCEQKPSVARKFLMAGKSGLNLTKDEDLASFVSQYAASAPALRPMIEAFDNNAVQAWARGLGQPVFTGSTGRVFPDAMKASPLLRAWLTRLDRSGVVIRTGHSWTGWDGDKAVFSTAEGPKILTADVTILAMGGASWARLGSDGEWARHMQTEGIELTPFAPSNAALTVAWSPHMASHFGAPIKSVAWCAGNVQSRGEATLSARGLEGGGLYALTPHIREGHPLTVDLVPDRSVETLDSELASKPHTLRLTHWLKKTLRLPPAKTALFFEMTAPTPPARSEWVRTVKALPVRHGGLRPMDQAISTAGGVRFSALTDGLMLRARPGVFCAGEMLDWEAPTGGYLLTACFATGRWAGQAAVNYLAEAA